MRHELVPFVAERPILLLVVLIGVGALAGRIRVAGVSLGPAAVLFCGLAVSAYDEGLSLPAELSTLGLVLFAYTIGLSAGPQLRAVAGRRELRIAVAVTASLAVGAVAAAVVGSLTDLSPAGVGGLLAGAVTNTPALAAVTAERPGPDAAVAYSLAYPLGVIAPLVAVNVMTRRSTRTPEASESQEREPVITWTVRVTQPIGPLGGLRAHRGRRLAFGRIERDGHVDLATADTHLSPGDLVTVIGSEEAVHRFAGEVGERADRHLPLDRRNLDFRRIILSNRELSGRSLGELDLTARYGATVTRVRRGDIDVVADDDFVVQLGDRLRVVGPRQRLDAITSHLGNSVHHLADIDLAGLAAGIAIGILIGYIPLPVPGVGAITMGDAGGTLIAGLVLGTLTRIGPLHFALPIRENLVLRNFGTVLLLAVIGSRSGGAFANAITSWSGAATLAGGLAVTLLVTVSAVLLFARVGDVDRDEATGMLAGTQTQPAVLAAAQSRASDPTPVGVGYAAAYPVAMVVKLVAAQLLVA